MKKSSFVAMVLGTASAFLFALGMCMVLVQEWESFETGVVFGCAGLALGFITLLIWRKMAHKAPIRISGKRVLISVVGIAGALILGWGMCLCMVWDKMIIGIVIGLVGMVALLCLIPLTRGIKE